MKDVQIRRVGADQAPAVLELVGRLLSELGEEGDETGSLSGRELTSAWSSRDGTHCAFLATTPDGTPVGVATLSTAFALYAHGDYGIINEMYVVPEYRSAGVGAHLLDAIKAWGRERGWRRLDVTAPESERWVRTRRFFERQGFSFTGPKLEYRLT